LSRRKTCVEEKNLCFYEDNYHCSFLLSELSLATTSLLPTVCISSLFPLCFVLTP
jgi:hypothetical protein